MAIYPVGDLPELVEVIDAQWTVHEQLKTRSVISPFVFTRDGEPVKAFRRSWHKACAAAGYPSKIPHDFRRTAVQNFERAGVSRSVAMKITGHKTESIYRRYAIVSEGDLREGLGKFSGQTHGAGQVQGKSAQFWSRRTTATVFETVTFPNKKWCRRGGSNPHDLAVTGF